MSNANTSADKENTSTEKKNDDQPKNDEKKEKGPEIVEQNGNTSADKEKTSTEKKNDDQPKNDENKEKGPEIVEQKGTANKEKEVPKVEFKKPPKNTANKEKEVPKVEFKKPPKKPKRSCFGRKISQEPDSKVDEEPDKVDGKGAHKKWGKAITGVRVLRKTAVPDPFLERFTVTGRSYCKENLPVIHHFKDIFTKEFWKTVVVDPSSVNYYYWSMIMMLATFYNLMIVIMRTVFYLEMHTADMIPVWFALDYLSDFLYLWDMLVRSRIGFLESGLIVRDTERLFRRYLKSWYFVFDVISILPFDLLYLWIGVKAYVRLNRILKTWRLVDFFHMAETHTNFPNLIRVSNLVLYIIIIIHWNGCFYYSISEAIGFGSDTWVYPDVTQEEFKSLSKKYLFSFYWSTLTLTTIGDTQMPETSVETFYCISCSLVGVLIFATIFGNVGSMINHMDAARTEFQGKVDNVKRYMELRGIGVELQNRVIKWFDYTWNNKQSVDDKESLQYLPEKLRAEISIHVHMMTLRRVAIFKDCEPGLLVELVLKLKLQVFSPGDFICKKGDIGKEMYIIKRGKLQVVSEDGKVVFVTLTDGAVFGEISVLNIAGNKTGNRRTASVKTVGYSDLFCLTKNDLWEALKEYPDAMKMLIEIGKQILRKDKLLDEEQARREERRQQAMVLKVEMIVDSVESVQASINKVTDKLEKLEQNLVSQRSGTNLSQIHKTPSPIPEEDENDQDQKGVKKVKPKDS